MCKETLDEHEEMRKKTREKKRKNDGEQKIKTEIGMERKNAMLTEKKDKIFHGTL